MAGGKTPIRTGAAVALRHARSEEQWAAVTYNSTSMVWPKLSDTPRLPGTKLYGVWQ